MITRRLMKPGTFSLKLQENTPYKIHAAIARLDHIVFTHTRLDPIEGYSDANILDAALHTCVVTKSPSPTDVQGHGLEWWLGTPKGYGPGTAATQGLLTTPVSQTTATLSTWVTALCPAGLTVGTVTNTGLPTLTNSYQFVTRREALDDVCRKLGAEYRINPDGTIDAAAPATLFGSSPEVVVTRKEEGRDNGLQGLEGSVIQTAVDVEDYITKAIVVTRGTGSATTATTSTGSTAFRDLAGNTLHVERYVDAPSELAANASLIGSAALNRFNAERRDLRLNSRTYNVSRFVTPGDYVFAFDLVTGLTDPSSQIFFRDGVITPLALRVYGLTFPIQRGMGVYARRSTGVGTATYTDLSDYVVFEDGDVSWEVGAPRRPLVGSTAGPTSEGTVAYLGVNPTVNARAVDLGARATWTPTVTQLGSVPVTVNRATVSKVGREVTFDMALTVTGVGGTAGNQVLVSLPYTAASSGFVIPGGGLIFDQTPSQNFTGVSYIASTTAVGLVPNAANGLLGAVGGFTAALATGDLIQISGVYEAAA